MFVVKSVRENSTPLLFGSVNAAINLTTALLFVNFMDDQTIFNMIWSSAFALLTFVLGFLFSRCISNLSISKIFFLMLAFLTAEIYLSVAWIYPASYFTFYGSKQSLQHDICCETPKDYGAQDFQTLKIPMSDGVHIEGWYVEPTKKNAATIILIHGSDNDRRHASEQARILIAAGYGVFMYDQRGNGQSEGILDLINVNLGHDLVQVAEWLQKNYQPTKIGVVGLSMGAHAALSATAEKPHLFSAVWMDGLQAQGLSDFPSSMNRVTHLEATLIYSQMNFVDLIRDNNVEGYVPVTQVLLKLKQIPIYLVAGDAEKFESDANKNYATLSDDHLQVWMVPNGGHLTAVSDFPDEYKEKLLDFFNHSLNSNLKLATNEN